MQGLVKAVAAAAGARAAEAKPMNKPGKRSPASKTMAKLPWRWFKRLFLRAGSSLFGLAMIFDRSGLFFSLGRSAKALATVAQDAATLAATVAEAGTNISVNVATKVVKALDTGVNAAEELWHGVDLRNASAHRQMVRAAAADKDTLIAWIEGGASGVLPPFARSPAAEALFNLSLTFPLIERHDEHFRASGSLTMWHIRGKVLFSGYIGAAITSTVITFEPKWSFIGWELLEMDWSRESNMIAERARALRLQLEPIPAEALELSDNSLETGSLPELPRRLPRWARTIILVAFSELRPGRVGHLCWRAPDHLLHPDARARGRAGGRDSGLGGRRG